MNLSPIQKKYLRLFITSPLAIGHGGYDDARTLNALRRKGLIVNHEMSLSRNIVPILTPSGHYHATMATLNP